MTLCTDHDASGLWMSFDRHGDALIVDFQAVLEQQLLDAGRAVIASKAALLREAVLQVRADVITVRVVDLSSKLS